jgi:hypothetical protein
MKPKKGKPAPEPNGAFASVANALRSKRGISLEEGWGAGNLVLKVHGNIFAMSVRGDLVVKLPAERIDALVRERVARRFDPRKNGRVMKEWAVFGGRGPDWVTLAQEAFDFVSGG